MFVMSEYNSNLEDKEEDGSSDTKFQEHQQQNQVSMLRTGTSISSLKVTRDVRLMRAIISYRGRVKSIRDALLLFEASRLQLIPSINRRLTPNEKSRYVKPNTIFVWNETQSGVKRWTDGKIWSPSKVYQGQFLVYKQLAKDGEINDGLIKQSISVLTKQNQKLHLISYYKDDGIEQLEPSKDPNLMNIIPPEEVYPESILVPQISKVLCEEIPRKSKRRERKSEKYKGSEGYQNEPRPNVLGTVASLSLQENSPALPQPNQINSFSDVKDPFIRPNFNDSSSLTEVPRSGEWSSSQSSPVSVPAIHGQSMHSIKSKDYASDKFSSKSLPSADSVLQLLPPPAPQTSHYRQHLDSSDSQTLDVLDKRFS